MPFSPGGGNTLSPSLSEQDDDEIDAGPDRNMHVTWRAAKRNEVVRTTVARAMVRRQQTLKIDHIPAQLPPIRPYHPSFRHRRFTSRTAMRESQPKQKRQFLHTLYREARGVAERQKDISRSASSWVAGSAY
jgi:hypothetical protein